MIRGKKPETLRRGRERKVPLFQNLRHVLLDRYSIRWMIEPENYMGLHLLTFSLQMEWVLWWAKWRFSVLSTRKIFLFCCFGWSLYLEGIWKTFRRGQFCCLSTGIDTLWLVGPVLPAFVWSESQEWFLHFLNAEEKNQKKNILWYMGNYRKLRIQCPWIKFYRSTDSTPTCSCIVCKCFCYYGGRVE